MDINTPTELEDFPKSYKIFDISYFSDKANAIKGIMLKYFWSSMLRLILLYLLINGPEAKKRYQICRNVNPFEIPKPGAFYTI